MLGFLVFHRMFLIDQEQEHGSIGDPLDVSKIYAIRRVGTSLRTCLVLLKVRSFPPSPKQGQGLT